MRYKPVKVHHIVSVQYAKAKPGAKAPNRIASMSDVPTTVRGGTFHATGKVVHSYRVISKLFGSCGHDHKTESGAERCKVRMEKRWHDYRSKQSKATAKKRKASWVSRMADQRLEGIGAVLVD